MALYPGAAVYPSASTFPGSAGDPPVTPPVINSWTPPLAQRTWYAVTRTPTNDLGVTLPIQSLSAVTRYLGVGTAVLTTGYSADRWASLGPGCGLVLFRDGRQEFTGEVVARTMTWDKASGGAAIKVECVSDDVLLADRLVFPDPLRAADDQTVNDYWTFAGVASTAMRQLISDQAGPTCRPTRQINGLILGADPGKGLNRTWTALFPTLLDQLATMSVASGADLGVQFTVTGPGLVVDVVAPGEKAADVKFSADLSNLVGFEYREEAPKVTNAVAAGQGDLHARLRRMGSTTDPLALAWRRSIWSYIDRRDTADTAELDKAVTDALTEGAPKVSLTVNLTDSAAATYGRDWGLGDRVTVYVGLPGQVKPVTVVDVVREVSFTLDEAGAEVITPAIGTYDATAVVPTPTQAQLARVGRALGSLIARK